MVKVGCEEEGGSISWEDGERERVDGPVGGSEGKELKEEGREKSKFCAI